MTWRSGGGGERGVIANVDVGMLREDPIGEESAQPALGPTGDDELGDDVEVGSRIDVVRDARPDDREDGGGRIGIAKPITRPSGTPGFLGVDARHAPLGM
jgi:hypothetical protein